VTKKLNRKQIELIKKRVLYYQKEGATRW